VGGQWDLNGCIQDYLGRYDFSGKRALDLGTAAGFLSFHMEKAGADVVSFDMASGAQWDLVPQKRVRDNPQQVMADTKRSHAMLQNAYWFSHARLQSKAKAFYGDIYDLPLELGKFDVAVFGMIIAHLRDPFRAIYNASRLVRGDIIITNQLVGGDGDGALFMPTVANEGTDAWWGLTQRCLEQMLSVMGFKLVRSIKANAKCLVAGRVGIEVCTANVFRKVELV
jgi:SAM-dependent methyltransferase